jgi:hypothetical protein
MKVVTSAGSTIDLGTTETTPTIGIIDYSRRVTDDYGVTSVVERGFARRMSVRMSVPFESIDALQRRLADLRATSALWIADDRYASLSVRGFYKDFALDVASPPISYCTLTVEGLTTSEPFTDPGGDPAITEQSSTLQLLQPVALTDAMLVSSTVAEADYAAWATGTTYALGARVLKAGTHRVFESAVEGNLGNDPTGDSGKWFDIGPTNRWAMFDESLGTSTTATGTIKVSVAAGTVSALALLDVVGSTVRAQATGYDRTATVGSGAIAFLDVPANAGTISVTITGSGSVSVGTLLVGKLVGLGVTEASPTAGITDYSRKEIDDFGAVTIVSRAWAKRMTANALIRSDAIDAVVSRITAVRARPALWIGQSGIDSLTLYGFFKDFSVEVGDLVSKLSVSIEGLSKASALTQADTDAEIAAQIKAVEDAINELLASYADLAGLADDGVLTVDEKIRTLIPEDRRLESAWALLDAQAAVSTNTTVASARSAAASARSAWVSYRGTIERAWNDTSEPSDVVRSTFLNTLTNYSSWLTRLADALRQAAGLTSSWDGVFGAGKDQLVTSANDAATKASSALSQIVSMVSDNILDRSDKRRVKEMYDAIAAEQATLVAQAQARGVDPLPLQQKQSALAGYLGNLSPRWDNLDFDTPLPLPGGGATLSSYFYGYYTARTNLLAAIDGKAREREDLAVQIAERAASDGWLDGSDKREATVQRQTLLAQMSALVAKHDALGQPADVTPYRTTAGNAVYTNLVGYLNGLVPPLNDFVNATVVNSSTYINAWSNAVTAVNAFDAALLGTVSNDVRAAVASVSDITADGVWSPIEKRTVLIPQDNRLEAAFQLLQSKASPLVGTSAVVAGALSVATNARANWLSFRGGRSPAWNDTSGPTTINRQSALEVLGAYGQNIDGLAEALRAYTDTRATTAVDRTTAMDSDGILAMGEKYKYVEDWQVLNAALNALNQQNQINSYPASVQASASNALSKRNSHAQLLGSISPAWDNGNFDSLVNGPALRQSWIDARSSIEVYSAALAGRSQGSTATPTPTPPSSLPQINFDNAALSNGWVSPNTDISMQNGQTISLTFSIEVQNQNADDTIVQMYILVGNPGDQSMSPINAQSTNFIVGPNGFGTASFTQTFTNYETARTLSFRAHTLLTDAPQLVTTGNNNSYLRRNS